MSAQQAGQQQSSQEQRGREMSLTRRGGRSAVPSLWADPLETFVNPFSIIRRLQEDINRAFSQTGAGVSDRPDELAMWVPPIEVTQKDGTLEVSAELPGLKDSDVRVEINNDVLTIQGERRYEHEETERGGVRRSEIRYGRFYRAIPLPDGADTEKASAEFRDGVLHVSIPVSQANARQIPVQSASSQQGQAQASEKGKGEKAA